MKRTLTILLCLVISISLICCGGKDDETTAGQQSGNTQTDAPVQDGTNAGEETNAPATNAGDETNVQGETNAPVQEETNVVSETTAQGDDPAFTQGPTDEPGEDAIDGKKAVTDAAKKNETLKSYIQTLNTRMTVAGNTSEASVIEKYRKGTSSLSYWKETSNGNESSYEYFKDGYFYTEIDGGLFKSKITDKEFEALRASASGLKLTQDDYAAFNVYSAEESSGGIVVILADVKADEFKATDALKAEMAKNGATVTLKSVTATVFIGEDGYIEEEISEIAISVASNGTTIEVTVEQEIELSDINDLSGINFPADTFSDYIKVDDLIGLKALVDGAYAYDELYEIGAAFDFDTYMSISGDGVDITSDTSGSCEYTAGDKTTLTLNATGVGDGKTSTLTITSNGTELTINTDGTSNSHAHDEEIVWSYIDGVWVSCYAYGDMITSLSTSGTGGKTYDYTVSEDALEDIVAFALIAIDEEVDDDDVEIESIEKAEAQTVLDENGNVTKTSIDVEFTLEVNGKTYTVIQTAVATMK